LIHLFCFSGSSYLLFGTGAKIVFTIDEGNTTVQTGCYGNIENVDTTGASAATAKQDRLPYTGMNYFYQRVGALV